MRNLLLAGALASGALGGTTALAQQAPIAPTTAGTPTPPPPPPGRGGGGGMMMRMADANHDGIVTRDEAMAAADTRFARLDTDKDGKVTPDEMQSAMDMMRPRRNATAAVPPAPGATPAPAMGRMAGPDGGITQAEMRDRAAKRFDRMDTNHDGKLDAGELAAARGPGRPGRTPPPAPPAGE